MNSNFRNSDFSFQTTPLQDIQNVLLDHYRKQVPHLEGVVETIKKIYEDAVIELQNTRFCLSRLEESVNKREKDGGEKA